VTPECRALHGPDFRRPASRRQSAPHRPTCNLTYCPAVTFVTIAAASRRGVAGPPPSRFPTPPSGTGLQPQVPTADDHGESARPPRRRHPGPSTTAPDQDHRQLDHRRTAPRQRKPCGPASPRRCSRQQLQRLRQFHDQLLLSTARRARLKPAKSEYSGRSKSPVVPTRSTRSRHARCVSERLPDRGGGRRPGSPAFPG
jgi:hypothetical protein